MTISLLHSTNVATPDDGTSDVSADEWNAEHTLTLATNRVLGRLTAGAGAVEELTGTQLTGILDDVVGDSGSGGTKGLVPAPGAGDAAAGKFLKADGTFAVPSGGSPGGASLTLQYNNASSFGGMSGTSWDDTNRSLTLTGATVTASHPVLDLSQTWNAGAVAFSGLKLNITDTSSVATSLLIDLQVGASSKFKVDKTSLISLDGNKALRLNSGAGTLDLGDTGATITFNGMGASADAQMNSAVFRIRAGMSLSWASGDAFTAADTNLFRDDAAGIIAQRNSTNAQTLRVYNTFTDASNYERAVIDWATSANVLRIGMQKAGTGSNRTLRLFCDGTGPILFELNTGTYWGYGDGYLIGAQAAGISWNANLGNGAAGDAGFNRVAPGVMAFSNGNYASNATTVDSYFQWSGQKRVTSDVSYTSTTTLGTVTGLSVNVAAGRTYSFRACLQVTDAATGGVKAAISGTATATAIQYTGYTIADNAIKGKTNATALDTTVGSTLTTETSGILVIIEGTITVNAAGTLLVQAAQNTSDGTATTIKRGSTFFVYDMP